MIDKALLNKMKPVRFKLSGILKMYESVLLKRRSADKTSKQDKIDDLVMNCVFADADGHK